MIYIPKHFLARNYAFSLLKRIVFTVNNALRCTLLQIKAADAARAMLKTKII